MKKRSTIARLMDIKEAIRGIHATLENVCFQEFEKSWHLQRAIERGLEILSEASRAIPEIMKARTPEIPWRQIADIGNVLRHEYQRVEPVIIWNITGDHLRQLEKVVDDLMIEVGEA